MTKPVLWGVHMKDIESSRPVEEAFIGIGWRELGDLSKITPSRDGFKDALQATYQEAKQGAIPVWGGVLYRFMCEMKVGDLVLYPSKTDRTVNMGEIVSDYEWLSDPEESYPNRRKVKWLGHFPRDRFSQSALYEIGSALTLFLVKNNTEEFYSTLNGEPVPAQATDNEEIQEDDDTVTSEAGSKAMEVTGDFIIKRLKSGLSDYEFEAFVAHLLECMGYHARVTQQAGDGGVDVIAHRDELGFEPPIIKVQCKQITATSGEPEVNQLVGTLGEGEYALFVNLGSFSKQAKATERNKAKLRLIDGEQLVQLVIENYHKLKPRYRTLIPLKQIYVADV